MLHYRSIPTHVACPVCFSEKSEILYWVDSEEAARHFVLREADENRFLKLQSHIETLWNKPFCDIVRCGHCGFVFANPYVSGDERFYTLAYDRSGYPPWKWEYQQTLLALQEMAMQGKLNHFKLLEIGAGDGAFVRRIAPRLTPKENVLCTEYSAYGQNAIRQYGVRCVPADARELSVAEFGTHFDVICMFQVLEHLADIDDFFQHLTAISSDNASLFIAVPNPARIAFNEKNGALPDMPPNHVGRWNKLSFETIADRHGWHLLKHAIDETQEYMSKVRNFLQYRFLRDQQFPNSVANQISQMPDGLMKRCLRIGMTALFGMRSLGAVYRLKSQKLGSAQWVQLEKRC